MSTLPPGHDLFPSMLPGEKYERSGGEPGSRRLAGVLWIAAIIAYGFLVALQQGLFEPKPTVNPTRVVAVDGGLQLMGQLWVKVFKAMGGTSAMDAATVGGIRAQIDEIANTPEQAVRAAILEGELFGPEGALDRLDYAEDQLPADSPLRADLPVLRNIFCEDELQPEGGADGEVGKRLIKHHGYFGKLALAYGKNGDTALRDAATGGGGPLLALLLVFALVVIAALGLGFVALLAGVVLLMIGKLTPAMPPPLTTHADGTGTRRGSLGIEVFLVFVLGFTLMKIVTLALASNAGSHAAVMPVSMAMQWLLLGVLAYPVLRGMGFTEGRKWLGLHSGRGVLREIGAGVVGYLASLPLLLAGVCVTFVLVLIAKTFLGHTPEPDNSVLDLVDKSSPFMMFMLATLALIWAPIVEETVFRGALFRETRNFMPMLLAGVVTAIFFACAHGYPFYAFPVLIGLATGFALIRYWRGSLIGCVVAHFIHNAFALSLMFLLTRFLEL